MIRTVGTSTGGSIGEAGARIEKDPELAQGANSSRLCRGELGGRRDGLRVHLSPMIHPDDLLVATGD